MRVEWPSWEPVGCSHPQLTVVPQVQLRQAAEALEGAALNARNAWNGGGGDEGGVAELGAGGVLTPSAHRCCSRAVAS